VVSVNLLSVSCQLSSSLESKARLLHAKQDMHLSPEPRQSIRLSILLSNLAEMTSVKNWHSGHCSNLLSVWYHGQRSEAATGSKCRIRSVINLPLMDYQSECYRKPEGSSIGPSCVQPMCVPLRGVRARSACIRTRAADYLWQPR
jgi:hypothetical protein